MNLHPGSQGYVVPYVIMESHYQVVDANVEGILELLRSPMALSDTWTRRAERHLSNHLTSLTSWDGYRRYDSYRRAVHDLNRLLEMAGHSKGVRLSLGNYEHKELRPTRSEDLLKAAEQPESDPFYPYFSKRLREIIEVNRPSIVGFSLNYLSQALSTFAMVGFLRREYPGVDFDFGWGTGHILGEKTWLEQSICRIGRSRCGWAWRESPIVYHGCEWRSGWRAR